MADTTYFKNYTLQVFVIAVLVIGGLRFFKVEQKLLGWSFTDYLWTALCNGCAAIPAMLNSMIHSLSNAF